MQDHFFKKKLKKRNVAKRLAEGVPEPPPEPEDTSYTDLMKQVNSAISGNPNMLGQLNKCVSNIVNNKSLMESLIK